MESTLNGIAIGKRLGDEKGRDHNFKLLAMLWPKIAVAPANTPPGSPVDGRIYIVGTAGTGAFAGHNSDLAYYDAGVWQFIDPPTGLNMADSVTGVQRVWNGTVWA